MGDLISRQALMKEFADFVKRSNNSDFAPTPTWNDAVSLVGSMPSAQPEPCEDAVSREAVLDKAYAYGNGLEPDGFCVDVEDIQALPPVTPKQLPSAQTEIIRCKDCKHVSYEPCKDYENVYVCNRTTFTRMNGGNVSDAFCSYAERRTDG